MWFLLHVAVKLLGIMLRNRCWPTTFHMIVQLKMLTIVLEYAGVINPSVMASRNGNYAFVHLTRDGWLHVPLDFTKKLVTNPILNAPHFKIQ